MIQTENDTKIANFTLISN